MKLISTNRDSSNPQQLQLSLVQSTKQQLRCH